MVMKQITISIEEYNVLRGTFEKALKIINSLGMVGSLANDCNTPKPAPKESKKQKVNKYKDLIISRQRGTKPEYLKK